MELTEIGEGFLGKHELLVGVSGGSLSLKYYKDMSWQTIAHGAKEIKALVDLGIVKFK